MIIGVQNTQRIALRLRSILKLLSPFDTDVRDPSERNMM